MLTLDYMNRLVGDREGYKKKVVGDYFSGYTVFNYVMMGPQMFPNEPSLQDLRECRGIIFDNYTGEVIRRPFHKFFNVGEREETNLENLDFTDAQCMEKLDGSMIAPFIHEDVLRWGTKAGVTDVAMLAEVFVACSDIPYADFAKYWIGLGFTPIFEFMSHGNRIVLSYGSEPSMVLLALRDMYSGEYRTLDDITVVPTVRRFPIGYQRARQRCDTVDQEEGYVFRLKDGRMVKMKTDWYISLHRAKSDISNEWKLIRLILEESLDDLLPVLDEETKFSLVDFQKDFWYQYTCKVNELVTNVEKWKSTIDRRDFAQYCVDNDISSFDKSVTFSSWDGKGEVEDIFRSRVISSISRGRKYRQLKQELNLTFEWKGWLHE